MTRQRAKQLRALIEKAATGLPDVEALEGVELFEAWAPDRDYVKDQRVRRLGKLSRLIPETHHSQADWPPEQTPAVWVRVDDPAEEWPEWVQPLGAEDAYPAGAKVTYQGKRWINTYGDGNIWSPGIFGWTQSD